MAVQSSVRFGRHCWTDKLRCAVSDSGGALGLIGGPNCLGASLEFRYEIESAVFLVLVRV